MHSESTAQGSSVITQSPAQDEVHAYISCQLCLQFLHVHVLLSLQGATAVSAEYIDDRFHRILFGGDQLTTARADGSLEVRRNSIRAKQSLRGLIPVTEDWHTKKIFLSVSI